MVAQPWEYSPESQDLLRGQVATSGDKKRDFGGDLVQGLPGRNARSGPRVKQKEMARAVANKKPKTRKQKAMKKAPHLQAFLLGMRRETQRRECLPEITLL